MEIGYCGWKRRERTHARQTQRIFPHMTTPAIVFELLANAGFVSAT
jgi:hypothetical protein